MLIQIKKGKSQERKDDGIFLESKIFYIKKQLNTKQSLFITWGLTQKRNKDNLEVFLRISNKRN